MGCQGVIDDLDSLSALESAGYDPLVSVQKRLAWESTGSRRVTGELDVALECPSHLSGVCARGDTVEEV